MPHTKKNHSASLSSPSSDPQKLGTKIKPVATKVSLFEDIPRTQVSSLSQLFTSAKLLQDVKLAATARKVGSKCVRVHHNLYYFCETNLTYIVYRRPIWRMMWMMKNNTLEYSRTLIPQSERPKLDVPLAVFLTKYCN